VNKMSSLSEKEKEEKQKEKEEEKKQKEKEKQRCDEIRRAGFVNVDQWDKLYFDAHSQKQLLSLIKNDPSVTAEK